MDLNEMQELRDVNEKELYKLLSDLRILKQQGKLDNDENLSQQSAKWRNTLEYSVLETCVGHHSKKCRLGTLALLVESKKSTLYFTGKELEMILLFLKYNLFEKMEYVPFIKKALKRLKDSLAVLQRQLTQEEKLRNRYEEHILDTRILTLSYQQSEQIKQNIRDYTIFFTNLRDICVNNLYPDATYDRRRFSLQILLLMQDLLCDEFKDIEWTKEQADTIFQCLLLDTYEPNKEMAYQILKFINKTKAEVVETGAKCNTKEDNKDSYLSECKNPTLLDLDLESQVQLIITIALELGNSIRPIDSVTAAYMLKISKLSPVIRNVLQNYCKEYSIEDNVTDVITLQLVSLLYKRLQVELNLAKQNIGMAIVKCSLYGYLFCMRSLLSDRDLKDAAMDKSWRALVADIISLCFELNNAVSVIVNNSSPEGHLPMDLKTLNFNDNASFPGKEIVTPQMVLLCSWRTVKEVSQLFGLLATKASIQTDNSTNSLLTEEQIKRIMKHLVSLLCETKHRGAFEQAYVGFYQLCTRLWRLTNMTLNALPMDCLHDILLGITGLMPGYSKLCATRRSAGVPFMIQAVLSSEPKIHDNSKISAFHSVMQTLLQFTNLENTNNLWEEIKRIMYKNTIFSKYECLPESVIENRNYREIKLDVTEIKTHSMNILRALFRHSQLGDVVKDYIADGLMVAFRNYDNKTWAERNAATLLFSALIIRVFGVQRTKDHINLTTDNKMTERIFFERYPALLPFVLNELRSFVSITDTIIKSNVQAILLLLSRLYITNYRSDGTDIAWKVDEFVNLVSACAKSPVQKTRELAARALVPLLTESTARSIVKKLFLSVLAQNTRPSANLIHGYLLQILEILTRLPSAGVQLLKSDVTNFLSAADWILKGLERRNNGFSCFPIATAYIDVLRELYNLNKDIIESCNAEDIRNILQQHLCEKDLLGQGPGEQMYKISALRFILCAEKNMNFLKTTNGQSTALYSRLLISSDAEIQSTAWSTIFEILKNVSCQQRKLLCTHAIRVIADSTEDMYKYNPKLQDAIFDFLYNCLTDTNVCCIADKHEVCSLTLRKLHPQDASNIYSQRVNYLRLLGKCMTTLIHELKDENLRMEYKEDIYRKVCDSNWIGSLSEDDIRFSVFDMLYDLFPKDKIDSEHCHITLDWWTVLLQLLVDDNANIRYEASKVICKIEPCNELECIERTLPIFFRKFSETVASKYPGVAISALFCWSVSLLGDRNYEMDETDVFNKCRNYDVFEPVRISELCFELTKSVIRRYSIDTALPSDAVRWMNYRLDTDFSEVSSFKDAARSFRDSMPVLEKTLDEILDPTYKDKLLQVLTYEKYVSIL